MKTYKLEDFKGGWFIGDFNPTLLKTKDFEISVRHYKEGDEEDKHVHKVADEYTVVIQGIVQMNEQKFLPNDIIHIEKGEVVKFKVLTDAITIALKVPSVIGDKYIVE
jgi:mannose-6-phosphate isomerase-like protein (cupin superfamily)